ncbi:MAG TPA: 4Fe-4S binding protein [Dehalococcoidia bacterium]|nr:4Fe-4S binding protein [Dehalococcoidia bacterium]
MAEQEYLMGNEAMGRGAIEAGVKVVAGYPGTPASEVLEYVSKYPDVHAEWCINEKVALEICMGASLCNVRSMAVMKHNGTNVALDFMMHLNYTGVRGGLVLISGDDPAGISSQNEEDSRIITRLDAHLPVFDPWCPQEAKDMVKAAFDLSEEMELCFVVRPVARVCHGRSMVSLEEIKKGGESHFEDDRSRFIMSALMEVKDGAALNRPVVRHRWLNQKQAVLAKVMEESPFNHIEDGEGKIGLVACGIGYAFVKEAEKILGKKFPVLKLGTLPLPRNKVLQFAKKMDRLVVYEDSEAVVEGILKQLFYDEGLKVEVVGRSGFLPSEGELSATIAVKSLVELYPELEKKMPATVPLEMKVPIRTRTQCVGCQYRGLLHALKLTARKYKGVVTGDIGCYDAGSFPPLELQSTIYCMGSSIPMASGIAHSGYDRPVFAIIGDSTFFHNGVLGLLNAIHSGVDLVAIVCDNRTTAMTGFQPHPGSEINVRGEPAPAIDVARLATAAGATSARVVNPYDIPQCKEALEKAVKEKGVSVIVATMPCYLVARRTGELGFTPRKVVLDEERCNGCKICVTFFGCPAIHFSEGKATIDYGTCVECGMCVEVCKRGAITWS